MEWKNCLHPRNAAVEVALHELHRAQPVHRAHLPADPGGPVPGAGVRDLVLLGVAAADHGPLDRVLRAGLADPARRRRERPLRPLRRPPHLLPDHALPLTAPRPLRRRRLRRLGLLPAAHGAGAGARRPLRVPEGRVLGE